MDLGLGNPSIENYLTRARLEYGLRLDLRDAPWANSFLGMGTHWSIFGGISFNQLWTDGNPRLVAPAGGNDSKFRHDLFVWPGFFFGMRYGR